MKDNDTPFHADAQGGNKLIRRRGWIPVGKMDLAILVEQFGDTAPSTCMTWLALLVIANDRRSATFDVGINVIRHLAGISLRTTKTCLKRLSEIGFIETRGNYVTGSKERAVSTYTILKGADTYSRTSCNNGTTRRASNGASRLHGSSEQSASALEESASAAARSPLPAGAGGDRQRRQSLKGPRRW